MRTDYSPTEFIKTAALTAEHFGFRSLDDWRKEAACKDCIVSVSHTITPADHALDASHGMLTRGVEAFYEDKLHAAEGPVFLYRADATAGTSESAVSFHIFNVEKSIAEAILIQLSRALASELGHTEHVIRINSLGDTESMTRYSRELTTFLRKRLDQMPDTARESMKTHALFALQSLIDEEHELAYRTPNPLEYLSDQSRKHFRDIIEFLDMSSTPYEIDPKMLGHHEYFSDALFALDLPKLEDGSKSPLEIRGGRFDTFLERKSRKKTAGVGAVAILRNRPAPARLPRINLTTPTVYIIQLGFGAKIRSLLIVDELRKAGITVKQDLTNDSLSAQLRDAEAKGVKHVIIIGQKEFVDGTVILRDMAARKQEPIPADQLVKRLKRSAAAVTA